MQDYKTPGVYRQEVFPVPPRQLHTGVPVFLGLAKTDGPDLQAKALSTGEFSIAGLRLRAGKVVQIHIGEPERFSRWAEFEQTFGPLLSKSYLGCAVRGFFENGGRLCYVQMIRLDQGASLLDALEQGLKTIETLDTIDLVCAPDLMWLYQERELLPNEELPRLQAAVLKHCEDRGDRFAILDSPPGIEPEGVKKYPEQLRQAGGLSGTNGALYYPWPRVLDGPASTHGFVPPCGHVAGVFARTDERVGVHKAPANEILQGVVDLEVSLTDAQQGELNPVGVNCLRAFPGRGIRVWGARTLSSQPAWTYVNVRRLFLTAGRWIERNMANVSFEPHNTSLWARIRRELTAYFNELFQQGALRGSTPQEAFYVKCDEDINPLEVREAGMVITEIGLAPALPNEFIVVRIIHTASGVTITGPSQPE
jgi:hypothetical protein